MLRRTRVLSLLATLLLVLVACDTGEEVDVGDGGGGDGGDAAAGTFVVAISSQPDQLDPHRTTAHASFQVLENVYDTLVVPNENLEFQPSLAESWETSEDGLTWTFTLRDDVTFHDGSDFTSADVAYSYNRIIDEEMANAFRFENVEEINTPDDTTVEIVLSEPTPNLLSNVGAFKGMAILPEGAADELDLNNEANGTGPFTLESVGASEISLTANEDYWGEGPNVEGIRYRFISEPTTAMTELREGGVHFTDNVPPQQVADLEGSDELTLGRTASVDYWYMAMNFEVEPFDDIDVRRAIAFALDREAIAQAALFDAATVNQTAIPEDSRWYHDYAPFEHDPEQAQQLLEEAGATDISMGLMVTDEFPQTVEAAQVIAANLSEIGIQVDIQVEEFATWLDRQEQGDFDAFMLGWLGNIDPFDFYHAQHVCDGSNNFHNYCNEEVDQLLRDAASEQDEDQRQELYDEAVEGLVDDGSYIHFYNPDAVYAWTNEVSGYDVRPDRALTFETVQLEE